jgi:serine/threonine-protein phosphatase 5
MSDSSSTLSSVSPSRASTSLSSLPSPEIQTLSLGEVTDEDRAQAAKIKTEANQAFASAC